MHVLNDVVISGPNTKSFSSLKSAKKISELSAIGRGLLQIGTFRLQAAFIFSDDKLEAIFTHKSFHLYHKTRSEPILSGSKKANQKAWKVHIQQQPQLPQIELRPDITPASVTSSAFG
jgi:hypothetical protein